MELQLDLSAENDYFKVQGNLFQNNTWDSFEQKITDRLKYFDVRNDNDFGASPLEYCGVQVKLDQGYYQKIYAL
jgi:hypothetical protein